MISEALEARAPRGLSEIERRPLLSVWFVPSEPMNDATLATSGSASTTSATRRCTSIMRGNEISAGACVTPSTRPVSCCGKKPFGTTTARPAVSATVAIVATSVARWCASTQRRPRS